MIFVKKNKLVGLYERAPNVLGLHVLQIKVVALSVRCSQTTHSCLDFGQSRVGNSVLSHSPSQSQSSSPIHARGTQTTQDPFTHYNRVIFAGCVEAGWRLSLLLSLSSVEGSERVLSNLSKILEIRNPPSLPPPSLAIILSPPS